MISATQEWPIDIVLAGVAFDDRGRPDSRVHGKAQPSWLPVIEERPDVDVIALELARAGEPQDIDPSSEEFKQLLVAESKKEVPSLETVRVAAGVHWRVADRVAKELGIRPRFATKSPRRPRVRDDSKQPAPLVAAESQPQGPLMLDFDLVGA